ncbi:MAG: prepilin-type N-terminal cleavage/methylation domain-containing protein [Desulfatiglandales bacterium]
MGVYRKRSCASGFTLTEVLVVLAILSILVLAAIPGFSAWLPHYKLKTSAQDLYSRLQSTKLQAIRQNTATGVSFFVSPDRYIHTGAGTPKTVSLEDYGYGINFDAPPGQTFDPGFVEFDSRGFSNGGDAYMSNDRNSAYYRIHVLSTGVVRLQKWKGGAWE